MNEVQNYLEISHASFCNIFRKTVPRSFAGTYFVPDPIETQSILQMFHVKKKKKTKQNKTKMI